MEFVRQALVDQLRPEITFLGMASKENERPRKLVLAPLFFFSRADCKQQYRGGASHKIATTVLVSFLLTYGDFLETRRQDVYHAEKLGSSSPPARKTA
jgi:hypothetical protein